MLNFLKIHQQKIAIIIGYLLVFALAFGLGRITIYASQKPELKIEEPAAPPTLNNSAEIKGTQTQSTAILEKKVENLAPGDCGGKIKGNISSSGKVFHVPGGAFYNRTSAEMCFNTAAEAEAAGFRKSLR